MKIIKCIAEKIAEEIQDAEAYIELAAKWKKDEPEAAELFAELSGEEMNHAERLHDIVTDLITEDREQNGDPPAGMMALYEYLHQQHTENAMSKTVTTSSTALNKPFKRQHRFCGVLKYFLTDSSSCPYSIILTVCLVIDAIT